MTGNELLKRAAAILQESPGGYAGYAPEHINLVLAETFEVNNRIRLSKGMEELPAIPALASLDDAVPYEEELAGLALPLGLACRLYADADNNAMLSLYKQEYAFAVNAADRCVARFE